MTLAVDSSVLFAVFNGEPEGAGWLDYLLTLRVEAHLVACDIVWAEVAPLFPNLDALRATMSELDVKFSPLDDAVCFVAGQLFTRYRKAGGPKGRMVPDFMIAAHAQERADGLVTADRGFTRDHFRRLRLFSP